MTLTSDETQQLRQDILRKRNELLARIQGISADVRHADKPLEKDSAEQAVELQNDEVLDALDEEARMELKQIDAALQHMDDGSYGSCVACGKDISLARLQVMPFADKCIDCAE
jgi:RNA polymerase-binding protein DksA